MVGHTIQKNNDEFDEIIVNFGLKYKQYYYEIVESNKQKEAKGQQPEKILKFEEWLETQIKTEKESKAIERYKKNNLSTR